ncbi:hypothetical protein AVEN_171647-1 [Araneus ventricosus]|uniref:Tc1-like transposase DDE domain-containing protein n=1 Tax=Araneus ventricosus TaxID=182803 RepID=A0A4Y2F1F1_ARAVE|nr:hypothetical protein AVEN_171647-1 [Araneus ventricosus]
MPISHSSCRWSCQGTPSARRTVAPLLYSRSYTGWWCRYYALGDVLKGAPGPTVVVEQTINYLNIIADQLHPYMAFVFPTGNGIFQQDKAPCHKARIVLEWFEEHTDEFHLMSWPPNSPDLNPMEHIRGVMERQLRAQTPPCPNIST